MGSMLTYRGSQHQAFIQPLASSDHGSKSKSQLATVSHLVSVVRNQEECWCPAPTPLVFIPLRFHHIQLNILKNILYIPRGVSSVFLDFVRLAIKIYLDGVLLMLITYIAQNSL